MKVDCESALDWMASTGVLVDKHSTEIAALFAAHVAACGSCKETLVRYEGLESACRASFRYVPLDDAELIFMGAARDQDKQKITGDGLTGMRDAMKYHPGESAEENFLAAARAQAAAPEVAGGAKRSWLRGFVALAAAALLILVLGEMAEPLSQKGPVVLAIKTVELVSHSGQVILDNQVATEVELSKLVEGSVISTADASHLQFRDRANAVITLGADTKMTIESWKLESTMLAVDSGTVHAKVVHREENELFEIRTPNARVTVVGTEFSVTYNKAGQTIVKGSSGKVRVERADGSWVGLVTAGTTLSVGRILAVENLVRENDALAETNAAPELAKSTAARTSANQVKDVVEPGLVFSGSLKRARTLLAQGQSQEAIAMLLMVQDGGWERDALLGDAYQIVGDAMSARSSYRVALEQLSKPPASLLADLATLEETKLNDLTAAAKDWALYLEHYPFGADAAHAHLVMAKEMASQNRGSEVRSHLDLVLNRFPRSPESLLALGLLGSQLLQDEDWSSARNLFERYVRHTNPVKSELALVGLMRLAVAENQIDTFKRLLSRYRESFPSGRYPEQVKRLEETFR